MYNEEARAAVRAVYPDATSAYTGSISAMVYVDTAGTGITVLGEACAESDAVELAWADAAENVKDKEQ